MIACSEMLWSCHGRVGLALRWHEPAPEVVPKEVRRVVSKLYSVILHLGAGTAGEQKACLTSTASQRQDLCTDSTVTGLVPGSSSKAEVAEDGALFLFSRPLGSPHPALGLIPSTGVQRWSLTRVRS